MEITKINSNTKTGKVYLAIFEILKKNQRVCSGLPLIRKLKS
jgi:hypothetical protein